MEYQRVDFQTSGLDVEVYDERYAVNDPLQAGDIEFYQEYALKYGVRPYGGPILELGSGTGRITLELARLGCEVIGLDVSSKMISVAEGKLRMMPVEHAKNIMFFEGDMTQFKLEHKYPLIIIPARALQCLHNEFAQRQTLKRCMEHLTEDGRLIVDVFDPQMGEYSSEDFQKDLARIPVMKNPHTGNRVEMEYIGREPVLGEQAFEELWRYKELGEDGNKLRVHDCVMRMRWATRDQMHHMFNAEGFAVEHLYSDFQKSPAAYGKEQIWVLKKAAVRK